MSEEEKPNEPKESKPGLKDGRQTPTYRVLVPRITLTTDRQEYVRGQIVDLSHLPQESIRWFLDNKWFETADGEPANVPAKSAPPCRNC
jgi:hypothetical protein